MSLFEEILKESNLLLESVSEYGIKQAIQKMLSVRLTYNDGINERDKNGRLTYHGKKTRTVYPFVYGRLKSGADAVAIYMKYGSSRRGYDKATNDKAVEDHGKSFEREKPYWKLIRVDRIISWSNSRNSFKDKADEFISKGLNVNGDERFEEIYEISPICSGYTKTQEPSQQVAPEVNPNEPTQVAGTKPINTLPQSQEIGPEPIDKKTIEPETQNTNWANQYNQQNNGEISLDNSGNISYNKSNNNKIEAPETEPIGKEDISSDSQKPDENSASIPEPDDNPISKEDVENELTSTFNKLMERWSRLN